jgi:hypothetical protein
LSIGAAQLDGPRLRIAATHRDARSAATVRTASTVYGVAVVTSGWSDMLGRLARLSTHLRAGSISVPAAISGNRNHLWPTEHSVGLLHLWHLGCAYREALVVTGPARGKMWEDDIAGDVGYRPLRDADGSPTSFTRWYRGWLDYAEAQTQSPSGGLQQSVARTSQQINTADLRATLLSRLNRVCPRHQSGLRLATVRT